MWARLRVIIGSADSYRALLWASFSGAFLAVAMALSQRLLSVSACMRALTSGFQAMLPAILILVLAWAISQVTQDLQAAPYLVAALEGVLSPRLLPVLVFVTAGVVSFATGTSWGTMGILMPLVVPLAHGLAVTAGLEPDDIRLITLGAVSSVLSGAVFGDHCSPISDTTIMSSMASGCDHLDHVRTQLPYALVVGVVGMVVGDIPTAFGLSPWIALIVGAAVLLGVVLVLGRKVDDAPSRAAAS
jgi:Na+/H+ antiporter NhaC